MLKEKGHIQKDVYEGWYSNVDECFYTQNEVEEVKDDKGQQRTVSKPREPEGLRISLNCQWPYINRRLNVVTTLLG